MSISFDLQPLLVALLVVVFPVWERRETLRLQTSSDPLVCVRSHQKTIGWHLLATALLLNIALILFGWRRYRDIRAEMAALMPFPRPSESTTIDFSSVRRILTWSPHTSSS